jgi:hypothetical protein
VPKDRESLRALRQAEMRLWAAIDAEASYEQRILKPSVGKLFQNLAEADEKRELTLLLVLAGAALLAIAAGFLYPGSVLERWAEFVRSVQAF